MAEKTIAGVRARYDSPTGFLHKDSEVGLLFAEIDRLTAENSALAEQLNAVAEAEAVEIAHDNTPGRSNHMCLLPCSYDTGDQPDAASADAEIDRHRAEVHPMFDPVVRSSPGHPIPPIA